MPLASLIACSSLRISPTSSRRAATRARAVQQQVVAGIDRAEAVVGDAGPLRGVGQLAGVPVGVVPGRGGAAGQLAGRLLGLAELAAILAEPAALARDLARAGQQLAALVLDPSLRLVLLGVLQPGQAALERLALVAPGVALGLGVPLGLDRAR